MRTPESRKELRDGIAKIRANADEFARDPEIAADTIRSLTAMCDTFLDQIADDMTIIDNIASRVGA